MEEVKDPFNTKTSDTNQTEITCKGCGSKLKFAPGTMNLKCEYCGAANEIAVKQEEIKEIDFEKFISEKFDSVPKQEVHTVKCNGCGAQTTFKENVVSDSCPFCGNVLVVKDRSSNNIIRPGSLLPFKIDLKQGYVEFKKWINSLWWAPGDLKKAASQDGKLKGLYIPYWTYDSKTTSSYTGERGTNYQDTESYTTTENGRTVTKTRTVTKIRWHYVSGSVWNNFDDVLVLASKSLPKKYTEKLEPWDLPNLVPFDENFLSGFVTETYQVDLKEGFIEAKSKMDVIIRETVRKNIGGDHQRIHSVSTQFNDVTFKHVLLPIWISAYRYNGKVYRFLVNGRTGEVQGERPYSWIKIGAAILVGAAAIAAIIWFIYSQNSQ